MRAVIQRVHRASVTVEADIVGEIGPGLLVLLGVHRDDTPQQAEAIAAKIAKLRIFEDEDGRMNRSVCDIGGEVLAVSQFTLYGDASRGNRPSFSEAARPELAEPLYDLTCRTIAAAGISVKRGVFGAKMLVALENHGPVTILLEA